MKKLSYPIIYIFLFSSSVFAIDLMPGLHFAATMPYYLGDGFYSGYFDSLESDGYTNLDNNPKLSLSFGISLSLKVTDLFYIQPEISINNNGGGISGSSDTGDDFTQLIDETTLEIPLFLKIKIPFNKNSVTLFAGPGLTLLVESPEVKNIEGSSFETVALNSEDFALLGFMIEGGLGLEIPFNDGLIFFESRYSYEFTDSIELYQDDFKQQCLYFVLGYSFRLGGLS